MKNFEVAIGNVYLAKVSNRLVPVRIDATNPRGGWDATNLATNKKVRIKSAQRLRSRAERGGHEGRPQIQTPADTPAPTMPNTVNPAANVGQPTSKPMSGMDAAVQVLAQAGRPMQCGEMVKIMVDSGTWKTSGKTPASTIYAAIVREIADKGPSSRFIKVARGQFQLAQ